MPNRNQQGDYRYAYQGQEKDTETGKEAFELRLWDARIGRWLTTDPYRQFDSPYLGMGNNPINFVDPDGGYCFDAQGNQMPCPDGYSNFEGPTKDNALFVDGEFWGSMLDDVLVSASSSTNVDNNQTISGQGLINAGLLLYSVSEGATGMIKDFDAVTNALKENTFLSRKFNAAGKLKSYKFKPDGSPAFTGNQYVNVQDVVKEAKRFKVKANAIKIVKAGGVIASVAGVGLSAHQIYVDGEVTFWNGADLVMGAVAFVPGVGWVLSSAWTIARATIPPDFDPNVSPTFHRFGE